MIPRQLCEYAFHVAVGECNPRHRVMRVRDVELKAELAEARQRFGIAIGKAGIAMAGGMGFVTRGIALSYDARKDDAWLPIGWQIRRGPHPEPTEQSIENARAIRELVENALDTDIVIVSVSGGASAQIEEPRVPLDELVAITRALTAAGAPIQELNTVRGALSAIKAGGLAVACAARIITLVASDVIGDPMDVVGSGPTMGPWLDAPRQPVDVGAAEDARRLAAIAILERCGIAAPAVLAKAIASRVVTRNDRAILVLPMAAFVEIVVDALVEREIQVRRLDPPYEGDVAAIADRLAGERGMFVAWGEPTLRLPPHHGAGGRAQHLALELAKRLRGGNRCALVAGSDGVDGPVPAGREHSPAGAFVDGGTWDAIRAAGLDPDAALARCDSFTALRAVNALFSTGGPTGVNHADIAIVG